MYNLLPQENKRELRREYILRTLVVGTVFLFGACIIADVALFPSYIASYYKHSDAVSLETASSESAAASTVDPSVAADLQTAQDEIALINALQTTSMHDIIAQTSSYKISGIQLIGITIGTLTGQTRSVTLTGIATTRESLNAFSQELEADKRLSGVTVPVSDYSQEKDIDFSLTMTMQISAAEQ